MEEKYYTCCFTGHRPKNLPWGYEEKGFVFWLFKRRLKKQVSKAVKNGFKFFVSGMALGVDMLAAETVLKLKKTYSNIKLECAIPCLNQTKNWKEDSKKRYQKILKLADNVTYVSKSPYFYGCMEKRNEYMLNKSGLVIAVFSGSSGGTKNTLEMAKRKQVKTIIIQI